MKASSRPGFGPVLHADRVSGRVDGLRADGCSRLHRLAQAPPLPLPALDQLPHHPLQFHPHRRRARRQLVVGQCVVVHISYKGGAPAVTELLAGRLSVYFATQSTAGPHIASGKLVALATTGKQRAPFAPDLPTVDEVMPGFVATNWYAFIAPGRTPAPLLDKLNAELVKALKSPEVHEELTRSGLLPAPGTRQELASFIAAESRTWGKVIAERKITAN